MTPSLCQALSFLGGLCGGSRAGVVSQWVPSGAPDTVEKEKLIFPLPFLVRSWLRPLFLQGIL